MGNIEVFLSLFKQRLGDTYMYLQEWHTELSNNGKLQMYSMYTNYNITKARCVWVCLGSGVRGEPDTDVLCVVCNLCPEGCHDDYHNKPCSMLSNIHGKYTCI